MELKQNHTAARTSLRGTKRTCLHDDCGQRFYDLNKDPMACPYCGTTFVPAPEVVLKTRTSSRVRHYKLENPQAAYEEAEKNDGDKKSDVEAVEDLEASNDTSGASAILDGDDNEDDNKLEVPRTKPVSYD